MASADNQHHCGARGRDCARCGEWFVLVGGDNSRHCPDCRAEREPEPLDSLAYMSGRVGSRLLAAQDRG